MAAVAKVPVKNKMGTIRVKEQDDQKIRAELMKELELKNIHDVPKLHKIVINVGAGKAKDDKKVLEIVSNTLRKITGQQPIQTIARQSIATFKLREGSKIGLKVTLRDERMYEFLDRLISLVMPRVRDFHGVSASSFDKQGNYSLGLAEQSVFPELSFEDTVALHGIQITLNIDSQSPQHSKALLEKFGLPFEKIAKKESK